MFKPADIVSIADLHLCKAVRFFCTFVGAAGYDSLPAPLGTGRVRAGAEEQLVGVVSRNSVKELAQSFVAFGAVAQA